MASKNKRKQTFKEEYSRSWDFIKPSRKGENHARCTLCSADFSIAASGRYDITQHIATAKHRSNAERNDSNQSILQFVSSKSNDYNTIRAEKLWTFKKYRFLLKNTGLWASKYRFVFPEVGMSVTNAQRTYWKDYIILFNPISIRASDLGKFDLRCGGHNISSVVYFFQSIWGN